MIIMPPEEIRKYITVNDEGQWCHDAMMPKELESVFEKFVKQVEIAKEYKNSFK